MLIIINIALSLSIHLRLLMLLALLDLTLIVGFYIFIPRFLGKYFSKNLVLVSAALAIGFMYSWVEPLVFGFSLAQAFNINLLDFGQLVRPLAIGVVAAWLLLIFGEICAFSYISSQAIYQIENGIIDKPADLTSFFSAKPYVGYLTVLRVFIWVNLPFVFILVLGALNIRFSRSIAPFAFIVLAFIVGQFIKYSTKVIYQHFYDRIAKAGRTKSE